MNSLLRSVILVLGCGILLPSCNWTVPSAKESSPTATPAEQAPAASEPDGGQVPAGTTVDLRIVRSFYALDQNKPPDMGSRDGDYTYFRTLTDGGTCGYLYKTQPIEAVYVLWDNKLVAGPLTTVDQVNAMSRQISDQMRSEHEIAQSILDNWPSGGSGVHYRYYDSEGRLLREE